MRSVRQVHTAQSHRKRPYRTVNSRVVKCKVDGLNDVLLSISASCIPDLSVSTLSSSAGSGCVATGTCAGIHTGTWPSIEILVTLLLYF